MRIILIGKNGQVGWELHRTLSPLGKVFAFGESDLNLTDTALLARTIRDLAPQVVVNAAAYTAVDRAEQEPDLVRQVNCLAPGVMAAAAREVGAALIHISTDYVFDGTKGAAYLEADQPNPLNFYGRSKLEGEQAVEQVGGSFLTLRTSCVYSQRGDSFLRKVLSWARKQEQLRIVNDQVGNPTWARFLAETIAVLIARAGNDPYAFFRQPSGIYHLAGKGFASRYEWAQAILQADPQPAEQICREILPVPTSEFPTPALRPLFTALDVSRFEKTFQLEIPPWEESLRLALNPD